MGIGILMWIFNTMNPDPTVKTAAQVATHASHLIKRTGSIMNMGYDEDLDHQQKYHESSSVLGGIQEEYIDQESCLGNRR